MKHSTRERFLGMRGMLTAWNRLENLRRTLICIKLKLKAMTTTLHFFSFVSGPSTELHVRNIMMNFIIFYAQNDWLLWKIAWFRDFYLKKLRWKFTRCDFMSKYFFEQEIAYFSPVTMGKMRKDQTCQKQTQRIKEHFCHKSFFLSLSNKHFNWERMESHKFCLANKCTFAT